MGASCHAKPSAKYIQYLMSFVFQLALQTLQTQIYIFKSFLSGNTIAAIVVCQHIFFYFFTNKPENQDEDALGKID